MSLIQKSSLSAIQTALRKSGRAMSTSFPSSHQDSASPEMFVKVKERSFVKPKECDKLLRKNKETFWSKMIPSFLNNRNSDDNATKIPHTLGEALLCHDKAIIVTTPVRPYTIIYVNEQWEKLCGYDRSEVIDKELDFLQGKETNTKLINANLKRLSDPNYHNYFDPKDLYIMNHKKDGTLFTNHVTVSKIKLNESTSDVEFLIGILEEVQPDEVPLRTTE